MIYASDFRNGVTFEMDGSVFQVVDFQHVKPGKGAAFVRAKIKNVMTGATIERTFNPADKMPKALIERKEMQYLYSDGDLYYFMDTATYEQIPIDKNVLGDSLKFIKENETVQILVYKETVFGVEPPFFVELKIIETEPGFKGDTATGATKPATVETGAIVKVPLFVEEGDVIRIDTRIGEYMERV
ncbi:MAG TPA: elongation factor P [Clostridiales bacterium]|nr:elongation factor P [Clostridiales bacterium]